VMSIPVIIFVWKSIAPLFLLSGLADLAANILSANPIMGGMFSSHSADFTPILTIAAVHGVERIFRWIKKFSAKELVGFVLKSFVSWCLSGEKKKGIMK
jgi:hypothetical protein